VRRILRELPLAQKLVFSMMATSCVALLVACSFFLGYDIINFRQRTTEHLISVAEIIGANSAAALTYNDARSATLVLDGLKAEPLILAASIYGEKGELFVGYRRDSSVAALLPIRAPTAGSRSETAYLTACRAIVLEKENIGSVCLQADGREIRSQQLRYLTFVLVFMLTSVAAALAVALVFKRFISGPILDLIRTTKIVSQEKNYGVRAVLHAHDDLGLLVEGFNEMLAAIEQRDLDLKSQVESRTAMNLEITEAKEAAEAANRAKSEFLANMSHEIRTPMNGVIGMTELALSTELTGTQRRYLRSVQSSAKSLMSVINDILDFSKIEAGKMQADVTEFNLENLLAETVKSFALRAHQKGLELMYEIGSDVPSVLYSDAQRLRQVLVNLIGNAIKFTERGEVITRVEAESSHTQQGILHFTVEDTGLGIASDKHEAIFDPFEQADGSHARKYGGTGLGLTISRRIVDMLGGSMWVESHPGKGSTFHFQIASTSAEKLAALEAEPRKKQLVDMRVLIVDDNPTHCRILQNILRSWKAQPSVASGARAALTFLENSARSAFPFRLLLIDADMVGTDGFALVKELRKSPAFTADILMMLTTSDPQGDAERCHELGIANCLEKPIGAAELLRAILDVKKEANTAEVLEKATTKTARGLHILLAEDSPVNQQLVIEILLQQGHTVEVAGNGKQAVAAVQCGHFDVVLMDVQMPEVDGLEASSEIRRLEQRNGAHIPILALTAHAMGGARERCLAAGMDGFIQKPFYPQDLTHALLPYCVPAAAIALPGSSAAFANSIAAAEPAVLNTTEALARAGGSKKLLYRLCQVFLDSLPAMWLAIQTSVANTDLVAIERSAHTLKGSAGVIGAQAASAAARELELTAKSRKLEGIGPALAHLDREVARLTAAVSALLDHPA
jgi:two-component system, sensor histidine kinase and response regulator